MNHLVSMTGFGSEKLETEEFSISVDIKTLNSKQADINLRLPAFLKDKELTLRNYLTQELTRGKIDVSVQFNSPKMVNLLQLNEPVFEAYYQQLKRIKDKYELTQSDILPLILKMPNIFSEEQQDKINTETDIFWPPIFATIQKACQAVKKFREQEGIALDNIIQKEIKNILALLQLVEPYEKSRVEAIKQRIQANLKSLISEDKIDQNRFEQELIYYLEKIDISEEKTRLEQHCNYFLTTMQEELYPGKKLGFIAQEIGREINTLGSKANEVNIQKIAVQMKDALEKVKEQILNVL